MKKLIILAAMIIGLIVTVFGVNYAMLGTKLATVVREDPRNAGVDMSVHYGYWVDPSTIVLNVNGLGDANSQMDVSRVVFHLSHALKDASPKRVVFAFRGTEKYYVDWPDFKELGTVVDGQNPVYLLMNFPSKVMSPDGSHAFGTWEGGLLYVIQHRTEDMAAFNRGWYLGDLTEGQNKPVPDAGI